VKERLSALSKSSISPHSLTLSESKENYAPSSAGTVGTNVSRIFPFVSNRKLKITVSVRHL
jgi:hypothetical protein